MYSDPIIDEVRSVREAIAEEHGNDLKAIVAAFQRQDAATGARSVSFPAKRLPEENPSRRAG